MKKNNRNRKLIDRIIFISMLITLMFLISEPVNASNPGITEPNSITLNVNNIRHESFHVSWSAVAGATKYKLSVRQQRITDWPGGWHDNCPGYPKEFATSILSYDVVNPGVPSSQFEYYSLNFDVTIIAYNNDTELQRKAIDIYLLAQPPVVESITNITSSSFNISWHQDSSNPDDHRLTVSKKNGATWEAIAGYPITIGKPTATYNVTGLQVGTEYKVSLQEWINWFGTPGYAWSDWTEDMVLTKPAMPVALAATSITANTLTANWNAAIGATGYKFYMKEKVSGKQIYNGNSTPFSQFLTSGLESGMQYEYQVSAVNESGESAKSNSITVTTMILPAPLAISANGITTSSFNARWNAVADATGYLLSISDGNVWINYETTGLSYNLTGLNPNFNYEYKVKAKFGTSLSGYSNTIGVSTKPNAPVAKAANNITTTAFNANWNTVAGATGYKLWIFNNTTSSFLSDYFPKSIGNVLTYNVKGLIPGNNYDYYVQVVTSSGESVVSNSINVTTLATPPVNTYTVSLTGLPEGAGTVSGDGSYASGQEVTITATPAPGSTFVNWTENGTKVSISESYTFILTANRVLVANFTLQEQNYSVTSSASPLAGGSTSIPSGTYASGQSVTITATPASGYNFVNWTEKGNQVSASASYTFTVTANRTLVANFIQQDQKVTLTSSASPLEGGTTSIPSGTYSQGQEITIRATPSAGYTFVNWTENGTVVSTLGRYKFAIIANCTLVAHFSQQAQNYTITSSVFPVGGGSTDLPSGIYSSGQLVTITATPSEGYNFVNWTESGMEVSTSSSYTFNITSNCNLVANFTQQTQNYTVTSSVLPLEGGTTDIPSGTYPSGELVSITATPAEGYSFVNWTENGEVVSTSVSYVFSIAANRNIVANFRKQTFTILTESLPAIGGSTNISSGNYSYNEDVTLIATSAEGYVFVNWTENGLIKASTPYYIFNVTTNRHLVANFAVKTYSVTAEAAPVGGGSIIIDSDAYEKGDTSTVSSIPNEGYEFVNWSVNGTEVSTSENYSFPVSEYIHLTANFKLKKYVVTISSNNSEWGYTNFALKSYDYGETAIISAMPNWGYRFVNWTENGLEVTKEAYFTFKISENRTLIANFEKVNGIIDRGKMVLSIYPNPATNFITVSGSTKGSVIKFVTLSGNIVNHTVVKSNNVKIDVRNLKKGFYMLIIENSNELIMRKLLVE